MLRAARGGADDDLADAVIAVARSRSPRLPAAVVVELTGLCAEAITGRRPTAGNRVYTAQIENEQAGAVGIDHLPPNLRGAVRAVLAALNDDPFDSAVQAELATSGDPAEIAEVIFHCLGWLLELDEEPRSLPPSLRCFTD
ncbi:hypothetical protein DV20_13315 [Amycolatopsis rifamycinica]|uniref:Uncharacterized protein n=1 Tax=Amycolatopsis rifamycinica TaxID=287986 RepID=A0A066U7P8_9PSEU|nr:hypothetical protein DV20_13315 [Amycolatopsis rifamycinica]